MSLAVADRPLVPLRGRTRPRTSGTAIAALAGAVATTSSFAFSWNPSFWGDEAASIMAAQRPLPSLLAMLGNIDAVHGAYYLFLHFWIRAFGISEVAVRFPSAIAVGLAAAGVVVLVLQLADRPAALIAGFACAVLPRFTQMGSEARSYAFSAAVAVWLTVLLVHLLRSRSLRWGPWAGYAALLATGIYTFLYVGLIVVVHAVFVAIVGAPRAVRGRFLAATGVGFALALPVVVAGMAERGQIAFLAHRHAVTLTRVLATQWFGTPALAVVCWSLIAIAIVAAVRNRHRPSAQLTLLATLWLVLPAGILLIANATVTPLYQVRYLSFAAPAAAVLVALGIRQLTARWLRVSVVVVAIALATPSWVAQRGEFAKDGGSDWRQVSSYIGSHATTGDGIYFDASTKPSRRPRLAMHVYPDNYTGLVDVALATPFDAHPGLWDIATPLADSASALARVDRLWVVDLRGSPADSSTQQTALLSDSGFHLVDTAKLHRSTIYEYAR